MTRHGLMQAASLSSQNDRRGRVEFHSVVGLVTAFIQAVNPVPALFQLFERAADVGDPHDGEVGQRARGRARDRFSEAHCAPLRDDDRRGACRVRCPRNRSQIVRILHAIEDYVEPAARSRLFERGVTLGRPEPHHPLMRGAPCGPVELRARLETHRDPAFAAQLDQLLKARTGGTFRHQHPIQGKSGPKRLPDGMDS